MNRKSSYSQKQKKARRSWEKAIRGKVGDYKQSLIFCSCLLTYFSNYPRRTCMRVIVVTFSASVCLSLTDLEDGFIFLSKQVSQHIGFECSFVFFLCNSSQTSAIKLAVMCAVLPLACFIT